MSHDLHKAIEATNQAAEALQKSQKTREVEPGSDLQKAIAESEEASEALLKSHVKEHTRVSASGAVTQVSAYDDKRKAADAASHQADESRKKITWDDSSKADQAAKDHYAAADAHIEALKHATNNKDINHHMHQASRHLSEGHGLHDVAYSAAKTAEKASDHANELSRHAEGITDSEDTSEGLNKKSSLHLLAMEHHQRAYNAQLKLARKSGNLKGKGEQEKAYSMAMADAGHHRNKEDEHGKEVQRLSKISIDARAAAHEASKKADASKAPEDHKAAAEAHRKAASLDWDSETKAEHEKKAQEHEESIRQKEHSLKSHSAADRKRTKTRAEEASDLAERAGTKHGHELASEAHKEAEKHAPEGHPAKRYHAEMAKYHSDLAEKAEK